MEDRLDVESVPRGHHLKVEFLVHKRVARRFLVDYLENLFKDIDNIVNTLSNKTFSKKMHT